MRLLCLILSLYAIVLSTEPCCADNDCQGKGAARNEHPQKSPTKGDDCPGCSPFFTCGSCGGFIVTQPITIQLPVVSPGCTEYGNVYRQPQIEKIALSIWLPPKIS